MPIFSKKFSYKSAPPRNRRVLESDCPRIHEKLEEFRSIQLHLDEGGYTFANGAWTEGMTKESAVSSSRGTTNNEQQLREKVTKLTEENNLLKIKIDILVDLLTENTVELNEIKENLMK